MKRLLVLFLCVVGIAQIQGLTPAALECPFDANLSQCLICQKESYDCIDESKGSLVSFGVNSGMLYVMGIHFEDLCLPHAQVHVFNLENVPGSSPLGSFVRKNMSQLQDTLLTPGVVNAIINTAFDDEFDKQIRAAAPCGYVVEWGINETPNGKIGLSFEYNNTYSKKIRQIKIDLKLFSYAMRQIGECVFTATGMIEPGQSRQWEWKDSQYKYQPNLEYANIRSLIITFQDGTVIDLVGDEIRLNAPCGGGF